MSPAARPTRMRSLALALRALRREWRSGELAVLWLSLSIAVGALSGVGFLVDRIGRAVDLTASEVLAADMRVESDTPIADDEQARATMLGLHTAHLTTTLSAIFNGDANQLANVRAAIARLPPAASPARSPRPARSGRTPGWPRRWARAWAASSMSARARCR